jgi:tricorn protease-like protein
MLVDAGADVNFKDVEGNSPLLLTCGAGELEVAEMLIDAGADVCGGNNSGDTPLLASVQAGSLELLTMLLGKGANVDDERKDGAGLLGMAIVSHNEDMLSFVLRRARKRLQLQDSMSSCQFFESLAEAFLDPVEIKGWLDAGVSPSVLVGELGALVSCCTLEFSVKERLEDVRAFISLHRDILQDPSRWPVKYTFEQLVSQEPDTVFGNKTGDEEGGCRGRPSAHDPCRCTYVAQSSVSSVCYSPDGSKLARAEGKMVVVCDASTGFVQKILRGHKDFVLTVKFAPDGKTIVSGSRDKTIRLWDSQTGKEVRNLTATTKRSVWSVAFSPDGTKVLSGNGDNSVRVWDSQTGEQIMILKGHGGDVNVISISPDGSIIASGSDDSTIRLWDTQSGHHLRTLEAHGSSVYALSFSPDGTKLLTGSGDNTIRAWDTQSGDEVMTLEGHAGIIYALDYSRDGTKIASGSYDHTIRIWDVSSGTCLSTLKGHTGGVLGIMFSPATKSIVSGSSDDTVKMWDTSVFDKHQPTLTDHG